MHVQKYYIMVKPNIIGKRRKMILRKLLGTQLVNGPLPDGWFRPEFTVCLTQCPSVKASVVSIPGGSYARLVDL